MLIFEENLNESGTAKIKGFVYDDGADRPAIIICSGGGYMFLTPYEGYPVAMAYFSKGFHSFICEYPICNEAVYPNPQIAVLKAIQYVK